MYRTVLTMPTALPPRRQQTCTHLLIIPLTIWICVCVSLRYGYYGGCRMVLGPNSSKLTQTSSVFVQQVQVRDYANNKGVVLYSFSEMPELNREINWSISDYLIVGSYNRQGFFLWLNKGSRIRIKLKTQTSRLNQLQLSMLKDTCCWDTHLSLNAPDVQPKACWGERKYEVMTSSDTLDNKNEPIQGKEAEYRIEEDDKYYVSVINQNHKSIIMSITLNVSSKMYDLTKAQSSCSTDGSSCTLNLFPNIHYLLLTTPNTNNGYLHGWYIELSFVARVITYIAILGFISIVIFLMLKYLGACEDGGEDTSISTTIIHSATLVVPEPSEAHPILPYRPMGPTYGTSRGQQEDEDGEEEEDAESRSSSSSEELYDAKLCVICYDDQRNCFFVPCGHCATCYECAQRIMEGDSKVCPICRRLVHKVRRLFNP